LPEVESSPTRILGVKDHFCSADETEQGQQIIQDREDNIYTVLVTIFPNQIRVNYV
jgi:hypothetical protein